MGESPYARSVVTFPGFHDPAKAPVVFRHSTRRRRSSSSVFSRAGEHDQGLTGESSGPRARLLLSSVDSGMFL